MAINSNVGSNQFLIVPNNVPLPAKSPRELRPDVQSHATALPYRKRSPVLTQKSRKRHTPSPSTAPKLPSDNGSKKRHVLHRTRDLCPSARLAKSGRASSLKGALGHLRGVSIKKTLSAVTQAARKMNVSVGGGSAGQGRAASGVGVQGVMNHDCFFSRLEKAGVHGSAQYHAVGFCR
jgi:hypothetical protein